MVVPCPVLEQITYCSEVIITAPAASYSVTVGTGGTAGTAGTGAGVGGTGGAGYIAVEEFY